MSEVPEPTREENSCPPLPIDWPLDLRASAFAIARLPWLPGPQLEAPSHLVPSALPAYGAGEPVRLRALPPEMAGVAAAVRRRRWGPLLGELFEVVGETIPGQIAVARLRERRGEVAMQVLYVPAECLERATFAPGMAAAS